MQTNVENKEKQKGTEMYTDKLNGPSALPSFCCLVTEHSTHFSRLPLKAEPDILKVSGKCTVTKER